MSSENEVEAELPATLSSDKLTMTELQLHDSLMNSIIRKYNPDPKRNQPKFDVLNLTKEGLQTVGLE
jgi:hypothetical protein